jgi:hypothetical protein
MRQGFAVSGASRVGTDAAALTGRRIDTAVEDRNALLLTSR